ncbi:MAG: hypothetical protein NT077_01905 [Candidatus Taylorbacteria bacterium]|nr:hypothetical protein [Candidatus Taylorbacteria bacterium]
MIKGISNKISKRWLIIGTSVLVVLAVAGFVWLQSIRTHELEIYVMNVPGTPAVLIRTPNDKRILINGGSNSEIIKRLTDTLPFYSKHLDMVIAAEPNGKATSGLIDVLNRYLVDRAGIVADVQNTPTDIVYDTFLKTLHDLKIKTQEFHTSNEIFFDNDTPDSEATSEVTTKADILFPAEPKDFQYSNASVPEIIMRIKYDETSILLTGHASQKVQKYIASKIKDPSDVLVAFNSAANSNLARELIASTSPTYLIYKVTKEPTKEKTSNLAGILQENRFNIHETGTVKIVSDGKTIKIKNI